jgi:hypothetical protein
MKINAEISNRYKDEFILDTSQKVTVYLSKCRFVVTDYKGVTGSSGGTSYITNVLYNWGITTGTCTDDRNEYLI